MQSGYAVAGKSRRLTDGKILLAFLPNHGAVMEQDIFGCIDLLELAERRGGFRFSHAVYLVQVEQPEGTDYPDGLVIPVSTQHYMMLKRNLIYTGITRGRQLVVLVGQKKRSPERSRAAR